MLLQKKLCQRQDVSGPIPQRRHVQVNLSEAVIQIAAEFSVPQSILKILVRGRNNPRVHGNFLHPAKPKIRDAVENAQQLNLHSGIELANFIEKQSSLIC